MPQIYQTEVAFGTPEDPSIVAAQVDAAGNLPTNYFKVYIGQPRMHPVVFSNCGFFLTTAWWVPIQGIGGLANFDRIDFVQPDGTGNTDPNAGYVDMWVDVKSPGFVKIMVYATSDLPAPANLPATTD